MSDSPLCNIPVTFVTSVTFQLSRILCVKVHVQNCNWILQVMCILLSYALAFNSSPPTYVYSDVEENDVLKVSVVTYFWYNMYYHFQNTFMCVSILLL